MTPQFKVGQQVRTTVYQEYDNGIEDSGYLAKGSIGVIVKEHPFSEAFGYIVDFGDDSEWGILENELEAMESEK